MRYFNSWFAVDGETFGRNGLEVRNKSDDSLLQFFAEHEVITGNKLFKPHSRKQYTSPG